ncbi:hypothetical protein V2H45_05920 [Tumidithrix elongata RA019]|uniref:Uncharacterized protein n=1 Tax=Tumidithrix elongata BACA0141 TaxID=2716417 RepID=A0AAW9Q0H0_9CYAN|nr:hypothetical protein [Tumidithrix elongata RA019]
MTNVAETLLGGNQAIRGYKRNGTFAPANAVSEFVDFVKLAISGAFSFQYDSDLRIVSLQADQNTSNYTIAIADFNENVYFSNTYQALVYDPAYLIVPAGHKVIVTPIANLTRLRLVSQIIAVQDIISLR